MHVRSHTRPFYPQRARAVLTCEYAHTLPHTQALEAFLYLQCDHAPPPCLCLGTTANSLRGVNFEQTQTSRKTISNHSSKPGILKLVDLVLKKEDGPKNFHFPFFLGVQDLKYDTISPIFAKYAGCLSRSFLKEN